MGRRPGQHCSWWDRCICGSGTGKQSGRTEIMETLGSPKDKLSSAEWARQVPRQQQMHTMSSRSVLRSVFHTKSSGGEGEMQDQCSTGGGFLTQRHNWGLGPRTHRKDYREKPVLKAIFTTPHKITAWVEQSSFPCHSLQKVPSHRALSKGETGSILTSVLGLGSPTVPASHTPPAH